MFATVFKAKVLSLLEVNLQVFFYYTIIAGLVVVTTMAGYAIAPGAFHIGTFLLCSAGTTLTSCAANAMNQVCICTPRGENLRHDHLCFKRKLSWTR